jgi:hypothetical protein
LHRWEYRNLLILSGNHLQHSATKTLCQKGYQNCPGVGCGISGMPLCGWLQAASVKIDNIAIIGIRRLGIGEPFIAGCQHSNLMSVFYNWHLGAAPLSA